ncbi:MAG: hypothetical protein WA055_05160 [Candidatus Moraniibacteriota bacterium]
MKELNYKKESIKKANDVLLKIMFTYLVTSNGSGLINEELIPISTVGFLKTDMASIKIINLIGTLTHMLIFNVIPITGGKYNEKIFYGNSRYVISLEVSISEVMRIDLPERTVILRAQKTSEFKP